MLPARAGQTLSAHLTIKGTKGDGTVYWNRALARFVAESKADKIYITYGAAHFPGFFAELRRLDPGFSIHSIKGGRPIVLPDGPNLALSAVSAVSGSGEG